MRIRPHDLNGAGFESGDYAVQIQDGVVGFTPLPDGGGGGGGVIPPEVTWDVDGTPGLHVSGEAGHEAWVTADTIGVGLPDGGLATLSLGEIFTARSGHDETTGVTYSSAVVAGGDATGTRLFLSTDAWDAETSWSGSLILTHPVDGESFLRAPAEGSEGAPATVATREWVETVTVPGGGGDLALHIDPDAIAAHNARNIQLDIDGGGSENLGFAVNHLNDFVNSRAALLNDHIFGSGSAHAASAISYAGGPSLSASTVEAAIDSLDARTAGGSGLVRSDVAGAYAYMGTAPVGLADADDGWTVARIHLTGHTTTTGAGAWDDRLTLTYT